MVRITGLDHVLLAMPRGQEDEARRFYGDLLGLAEVEKPGPLAARGGVWFEGPGTVLHLGIEAEFTPARKAHPALRVADLDALRAAFAAAGVRVTPDDTLPNVRRFYAHDPFGNRIEFIQEGDGFAQRSPHFRAKPVEGEIEPMAQEDSDLPKLASPARRALAGAGITRLSQLAGMSEAELMQLHGIGPNALKTLRLALQEKGLSFRPAGGAAPAVSKGPSTQEPP